MKELTDITSIRGREIRRRFVVAAGHLALIVALGLSASRVSHAHGGEDHGEAATLVQPASGRHTASAQSAIYDIVVEYGVIDSAEKTSFDIYLSDYETNAPIAGATLQASVDGLENVTASATAEADPGLYNISFTFPKAGNYDLLFDITSGDKSDLIDVKGIRVGADERSLPKTESHNLWFLISAGIIVFFVAAAFIIARGRRAAKRSLSTAGVVLLVLGLSYHTIHAHGGEDHGDAASTIVAASAPGYMSKGSQFLLGVRTVLARKQMVSKQIAALGRVVAPPTSQVQVYAPQSGMLTATKDVPYPGQGDEVNKGQPIAVLQVLDQFVIRAPISGVVSAVHAVPGEQVDPSHELFTIYDYTKVWVEANLFESDLVHLEPRPPAALMVDIYPGKSFPARFINFDNVVDPSTRTLRAIYEVSNTDMALRPGMLVNVDIESESRTQALVVSAASIMDWEGTKVVFVHIQPEVFEMRPLKILGYYGDVVAVEGPLAEGERVVTIGAYELLNIPHRTAEGRPR